MSTQKTDTSSIFYDPTTMAGRGALAQDIPLWQQYIQHPFNNPMFNRMQQLGTQSAQQAGQTMMGNLLTNAPAFQTANPGAFQAQQMGQIGRTESALQSQAIWNAIAQGLGLQSQYSGLLSGLPALQTGGQVTEKTSGLGTWLPQAISGGLGVANMLFGKGGSQLPTPQFTSPNYPGALGQGGPNLMPNFPQYDQTGFGQMFPPGLAGGSNLGNQAGNPFFFGL